MQPSQLNTAKRGGFLYISRCNVAIFGEYIISSNTADYGGAVYAEHSSLATTEIYGLHMVLKITNNSARVNGGGLFLDNSRMISNIGRITMAFTHNSVRAQAGKGGAIFVPDDNYCEVASHPCLVDYYDSIHLIFSNNIAKYGSALYGGLLDRCSLNRPRLLGIEYYKQISDYQLQTPPAITSDPIKVCLCSNSNQICATREMWVLKMRGEAVVVYLTGVDQTEYPLISTNFKSLSAQLDKGESKKEVSGNCSKLSYHVFTTNNSATLELHPEGPCDRPASPFTLLF